MKILTNLQTFTQFILAVSFIFLVKDTKALRVGRGIADITGHVAEGVLFGYAKLDQTASGLHLRQFCRSFVFESEEDSKSVVIAVAEISSVSYALKLTVVERLNQLFSTKYTTENVMILATHSHSAPGGINTYQMYSVVDIGFTNQTFQNYVNGIVKSITNAHNDLQSARVRYSSSQLRDANLNRSPSAYDKNPVSERRRYSSNTDITAQQLNILTTNNSFMGLLNFFPVHTTSMRNTNQLVSTDNKGYASQMTEREIEPAAFPGKNAFLAAFAQSNHADVTPNIQGAFCEDSDVTCNYETSTCEQDRENPSLCRGRGPSSSDDMFENTRIIGDKQYRNAVELLNEQGAKITGTIDYRFKWVNMSAMSKLCGSAMGYSFAAGTSDGAGLAPFTQGILEGDDFVDGIIDEIFGENEPLRQCQKPKPVILPTVSMDPEYPWQPQIVPVQLFQIGSVYIAAVSGELSTMAGRRLGEKIRAELKEPGVTVITASLANGYTSYIVTPEEYTSQRYEAASTVYGQFTLDGYTAHFTELVQALNSGKSVDVGTAPPDLRGRPDQAFTTFKEDTTPEGKAFGDLLTDVNPRYRQGETVSLSYVSGNPRLDSFLGESFFEVQRNDEGVWSTVYTDSHWETRMIWKTSCQDYDECGASQSSNITIQWYTQQDEPLGRYRISYRGLYTSQNRSSPYSGTSSQFTLKNI